tara:strand:+ start:31201 stop:31983 length:783 start_codon:yes stop_codon:yes gene_type:complete
MQVLELALPFIWGMMIGSFMNVVVLRLPINSDIIFERSGCPKCRGKINWYDNIPILSFIILKGKCRNCEQPISWQYPLFELWHGFLALLIFNNWPSFDGLGWGIGLSHFFMASIFSAHILIDIKHQLLLDKLNLALLPFALVIVWFAGNWFDAAVGAIVGFSFPLLVTWVFYLLRGQIGLGGGDIKLFGILGLLFGIKGVLINLFTSCMLGSVITIVLMASGRVKRDQSIPFGPYILSTALIQLLLPEYFAQWQNFLIPY